MCGYGVIFFFFYLMHRCSYAHSETYICMCVCVIIILIGAFGTVTKGLLKGLDDLEVGGRVETMQTKALLSTARILRRVLET